MTSFSGPLEIYNELVENVPENEEWILGLLAFAVFEEQKIEWIKHYIENNGTEPSDQQIVNWYQQQPRGALLRAKDTAQARLTSYGQNSITAYMTEFEKETVQGIIVSEIRETKRLLPQLGIGMLSGYFSSMLFAASLLILAFLVFNDSSPVEFGKKFGNHEQEITSE
jgi:hypothetical protein